MDYGDGTVSAVDGSEERQCDSVVTTEGDYSGQGLAVLCWAFLLRVRGWGASENAVVTLFDLVERPGVVVSVVCQPLIPLSYSRLTK